MADREQEWAAAMRAANLGDSAAYENLLREIASALRHLVRRRLSGLGLNPQEAEDVIQEVLLAVHLKRETWDSTRPFLPWIHAIARYKLLDTTRRLGRSRRMMADVSIEDVADRMSDGEQVSDLPARDLDRMLDTLPQRQRDLVRARSLEGASVQAVAERYSMSEGAVRVAYHRALRQLGKLAGNAKDELDLRS